MKHCIIVKWNESVDDKEIMCRRVAAHFEKAKEYDWVENVEIIPNCIERPNRYDIAVVITLSTDNLPLWDSCDVHHEWKETFSSCIAQKAIFDFQET